MEVPLPPDLAAVSRALERLGSERLAARSSRIRSKEGSKDERLSSAESAGSESRGGKKDLLSILLLSLVLTLTFEVVSTRKGICTIKLAWRIGDLETISGEDLCLTSLAGRKLLGGHEIFEGFMICNHLDILAGSFELGAPVFKRADNSQEFLVIDRVVDLGWCYGFGEIAYWVLITIKSLLAEDGSYYCIRHVSF